MRANHFETAYATDGFSTIAMAQKERSDLIILDIGLPAALLRFTSDPAGQGK